MKKLFKYFSATVLSVAVCLSLSFDAQAQHQSNNSGGGGGGSRSSSPAAAPAPSYSPRVQSAPAPSRSSSSSNYARPSYNNATHAPVRSYNNTNGSYPRAGITQRPYYSGHGNASTGAGGVNSYRSYQGSAYGHARVGYVAAGVSAHGYLPGNAYYHYNRGYYHSHYYPQLGFSCGYLPFGYYAFLWDNDQYFYSGGLFYRYDNDEYTVVEPPVGAEVKTLPANAQSIVINGQQYYEVDGVYYEPITKDDGSLSYQVAGKDGELNTDDQNQTVDNGPPPPQIGDIIPTLPPNCRKININGEKLYLSEDGVYYKAIVDDNGNKSYKIVGLPVDDDQQQVPPQQN